MEDRMTAADLDACIQRSRQEDVPTIPAALMRRLVTEVQTLLGAEAAALLSAKNWQLAYDKVARERDCYRGMMQPPVSDEPNDRDPA